MKKQLIYIAPLKAGLVLGILYGLIALIIVPFFMFFMLVGASTKNSGAGAAALGLGFAIMIPLLYAVAGFIGGIIVAAIYNLIAKWIGGLEFEVRDIPPAN